MSVVRSAWKMTVLAGFCAVVGYFLMPGELTRDIAYSAIGLASVACVMVGVRRRRPADPRAWYSIAAGILAFVVGDGVYDLYHFVLHQSAPFPSVADAFYLSGYPFLIVGVARLTRGKGRQGAVREGYADAGIVAIGALALSWQFLIGAYAHDSSMGMFGRFVTMSYPVLDLAVLFIVIQGFVFGTARRSVHTLLAAAMLAIGQADSAMYVAKASGKDRFAVFEEFMHARIVERLQVINAFNGSLSRSEFFLEYQPQFSLRTGNLEGFEALIRWRHPTLGLILPDRFIALAEETGYIVPIGRWVLEMACVQAAQWSTPGRPLSISVNLSGRQLQDPNLVNDVRTVVALSGLQARILTLEITESMLIVDTERTRSVLADLKGLGVRLAIDDFGTGYSSLNYLRRFPVDELKIDKSFVDPLANPTGEGAAFITTIVGLARSLGLLTVAEGVEEADQQEQLTRLGCDSAQGFLLARPLDAAGATEFVATEVRRLDGMTQAS